MCLLASNSGRVSSTRDARSRAVLRWSNAEAKNPARHIALREREAVFTQRRQKRSGQHRVNAVIAVDELCDAEAAGHAA